MGNKSSFEKKYTYTKKQSGYAYMSYKFDVGKVDWDKVDFSMVDLEKTGVFRRKLGFLN